MEYYLAVKNETLGKWMELEKNHPEQGNSDQKVMVCICLYVDVGCCL